MMPINFRAFTVFTVQGWRTAAPSFGVRTWKSAMDRFAMQHGKAIAMLANDGARIVERDASGRLVHHELPAGSVYWNDGFSRLPANL
jgi:hypothetical protein